MHYILPYLFFFFFTQTVLAQEKFVSKSLETIFSQLSMECRKHLIEKRECDCAIKGTAYQLRCKVDGNKIFHLGLKVFDDSVSKFNNYPVYSFIERELLSFILADTPAREARRKEDKVYLYYSNNFQTSKVLNSPEYIQNVISDIAGISTIQDSLECKVLCTNTRGEKLVIEFPVINTLISGMDKKELDENIFAELSKDTRQRSRPPKTLDGSYSRMGDFLVVKGEHFILKDFTSDKFYQKEIDNVKLIFDKRYVVQSLSNLLLTGEPPNRKISIDLKIKGYGNNDKFISMTVDKFLCHFDQFKLYFGIEDPSSDHLRGTLVLYNPKLNYLHLLDIRTDKGLLFGTSGRVTGTLYPYIPTQNIKDLFRKSDGTKSIIADDILNQDTHE